jgi:LysR family hydrogen peroxide-inducible transcriptional activator
MTITQLEYVLAVDDHRNFAEAARQCFITQPTLSMQIKKLEEELGVLLFDRSKKPVIPTEMGQKVIAQAREGLARLRHIPELIREQQEGLSGLLRVGVLPTLSPYLLPRFLPAFAARYPQVELQVREGLTDDLVDLLQRDRLDLALLVTPLDVAGIRERPLFYERIFVYLSQDYPLAAHESVDGAELDLEDMWVLRDGHCFREQVVRICGESADPVRRRIRFEAGHLETLRKLVDRQYGFTMLPELAVLELDDARRRQIRPFRDPVPLREISVVTHRSFLKERLVDALATAVRDAVPERMREAGAGRVVGWKA